jgi:hypothetical protein
MYAESDIVARPLRGHTVKYIGFVDRAGQHTMTNEFIVVGEHKENELELLVKGADGAYYDYDPVREHLSPVEPDENWVITEQVDEDMVGGDIAVDTPDAAP